MRLMLALAILATMAVACPAAAQDGLNLVTGVMAPPVCPDPYGCYVAPDGRTAQQLVDAHVLPDPRNGTTGASYADDPALPPVTLAQVCTAGWTATVRPPTSFTNKLRAQMTPLGHKPGDGELDHDWSIEDLGYPGRSGNVALTLKNVWWMIYADLYGARVKDVLETKLHRLLCAGTISPQQARDALLPNWLVGYQKYVGPLPGEHVHAAGSQSPSEPDAIPAESAQPAR